MEIGTGLLSSAEQKINEKLQGHKYSEIHVARDVFRKILELGNLSRLSSKRITDEVIKDPRYDQVFYRGIEVKVDINLKPGEVLAVIEEPKRKFHIDVTI